VLAIIGISLSIIFARPGPPQDASAGLPAPAAAPDQDAKATLIAHYMQFHWAWVLAYADGRVVWQFEGHDPLFKRRLTPHGVELVRSGAIQLRTLIDEARPTACADIEEICPSPNDPSALPAGAWADSQISIYEPPRWAIGTFSQSEIDRFPAAAQALLRGAELATYHNVWLLYPDKPQASGSSLELTTAELSALRSAVIDAGIPEVSADRANHLDRRTPQYPNAISPPFVSPEWISVGQGVYLRAAPILPHGEPIAWLG
jgi:hypothetical protein